MHFKLSCLISDNLKKSIVIESILEASRPGNNISVEILRFLDDPSICPVESLDAHISSPKKVKKDCDNLFISSVKPHKAVTSQTMSKWVVSVLRQCNINSHYSAHSTRGASSTKASLHTDINVVLKMAGWSSSRNFAQFYKKPIVDSSSYVNSVLRPG